MQQLKTKTSFLDGIIDYFNQPKTYWLNREQAAAYALYELSQAPAHPSGLTDRLPFKYPGFDLSDTILFDVLEKLENEGVVVSSREKTPGRGRHRRMYSLVKKYRGQAEQISALWQSFVNPVPKP